MEISIFLIIAIGVGSVIGGLLLLKQSAKKFDLTEEQKANIKKRNAELEKEEAEEDKS